MLRGTASGRRAARNGKPTARRVRSFRPSLPRSRRRRGRERTRRGSWRPSAGVSAPLSAPASSSLPARAGASRMSSWAWPEDSPDEPAAEAATGGAYAGSRELARLLPPGRLRGLSPLSRPARARSRPGADRRARCYKAPRAGPDALASPSLAAPWPPSSPSPSRSSRSCCAATSPRASGCCPRARSPASTSTSCSSRCRACCIASARRCPSPS